MNSWRNLSLILLSTVAVVADAGDSMHGGWQPATRYSYWIPPLPEPNVSHVAVAVRLDWFCVKVVSHEISYRHQLSFILFHHITPGQMHRRDKAASGA